MLVDRKVMIEHLAKVAVNGQITEAVFTGAFECRALTTDGQLMVLAPALKDVEPLTEDVGCTNLAKLQGALKSLVGDNAKVAIEFVDERIRLEQRHGGWIHLATALPKLIQSHVQPDTVKKVLAAIPKKPVEVALSQVVVQTVLEAASIVKPEAITLKVEKSGGTLVLGQDTGDQAGIALPIKLAKGEEPYELRFAARVLLDVFKQLSDFTSSKLTLTGPDSIAIVGEGAYRYVISPQEKA